MSQGSHPFHNSHNDEDTYMESDISEENRSSMHHSNNINLTTMTNISQHETSEDDQLNNKNNLKFFPYSNNKLTRSTGTLNLSLSMINLQDLQNSAEQNDNTNTSTTNPTTSSTTTNSNNLQNINEDDESVDQSMDRWSPFNETNPITPKLKRTASKSHLSPFITDTDTLTRWKYMKPDIQSKRNVTRKHDGLLRQPLMTHLLPANDVLSNKENTSNFTNDGPLFSPNNNSTNRNNSGLQSKLMSKDEILNNRNKISIIPNTPIKRNPLKDANTNIFSPIFQETDLSPNNRSRSGFNNSIIYNDDINSMNHNLTFTKSPSILTPKLKLPSLMGSPRSPSPQINEDMLYSGNGYSQYYQQSPQHSNNSNRRLKKIKKSRESVIFKNIELTHSLQQFTDDLYGTDDDLDLNESEKKQLKAPTRQLANHHPESSLSFFHKFPPPIKLPTRAKNSISPVRTIDSDNNSSDEQCLATPTRKNFHHNQDVQRQERPNMNRSKINPPAIKIESPSDKIEISHIDSKRTERHINASVKNRTIPQPPVNPDNHLYEQFNNVQVIGQGQFSKVYQVTLPDTGNKYAVKSVNPNKHNPKARIIQEISLLAEINKTPANDQEGKEYIIDFISSWKEMDTFYIMTNYYENGNLDKFLEEQIISKKKRLEDWRIWKIVVELSLALRFIHNACHIVHLDIKPANVMITFEGNLKLADFGMATHLPLEDLSFENEGDREYIAPEIISDCVYDYRADIFSLGLMVVEIAANVVLPDNGNAWHKLRSGDLSDAGRLSSSEIHSESLFSTASTKVDTRINDYNSFLNENSSHISNNDNNNTDMSTNNNIRINNNNSLNLNKYNTDHHTMVSRAPSQGSKIPAWVPKFLIDGKSLEKMVKWMIEPDYKKRPTASQILETEECQYVEVTRKAGAVIQEDDFGPKPSFF
ncbi:hypothetical protein C6P44_000886 [Monosporozyma unispora]|nr:hypothetical protein C6P44_000886 [Kazachstania unispora]